MLKQRLARTSRTQNVPRVDWSNPLVREIRPSLVVCVIGNVAFDAVKGKALSRVGTSYGPRVTRDGIGMYTAANSNDSAVAASNIWDTGYKASASDRFFLCRLLLEENAAMGFGFLFGSHDGTSRAYISIGSVTSTLGMIAGWGGQGADTSALVASGVFNAKNIVTGSFTAEGYATSGVTKSIYANGRLLEQQSACSFGAQSTQNMWFGRRSNSTGLVAQAIAVTTVFAIVGKGAASAAAHKALHENPWQIFKPRRLVLFSGVTAQFLRPISDIGSSGWTPSAGGSLSAMIGEAVRDDATYISATTVGAWFEVLLGTSSGDPLSSINHLPRITMSAGSGGIILRLKQGGTVIKEWTYASLASSDTTYEPTLNGAEIDSITDYTDLRLYGITTA